MKSCLETPNLDKIWQKFPALYMLTWVGFIVVSDRQGPWSVALGCYDSLGGMNVKRTRRNITL